MATTSNKKIARRQVIRENGKLKVVYVDVATGNIVTDLTGYEISSADIGRNPVETPVVTPPVKEPPKQQGDGSTYTAAEPFDWGGFASRPGASKGSGNMLSDIGKTVSGAVQGALGIVDRLTGRTPAPSGPTLNSSTNALKTYQGTTGSATRPSTESANFNLDGHNADVRGILDNVDLKDVSHNNWKVDLNPDQVKALITQVAGTRMITDAGIAAMLAHAEHESGFNPNVKPGDGGKAFGLFQWNNRAPAMKDWTTSTFGPGADKYAYPQVMFAMHELETTEDTARRVLISAKTVEQANYGMALFERYAGAFDPKTGKYIPDGKENQERLKDTNKYYTVLMNGDSTFGRAPGSSKVVQEDLPGLTPASALGLSGPNATLPTGPGAAVAGQSTGLYTALQNLKNIAGDTTPVRDMSGNPVNMNGYPVPADPLLQAPEWKPFTDADKANVRPGVDPLPEGVGLTQNQLNQANLSYQEAFANQHGGTLAAPANPFAQSAPGVTADTSDPNPYIESYLATINKSLGSPTFDSRYDGSIVSDVSTHPNTKVFLGDGSQSTTAAGYGQLPFGLYTEAAAKVGVSDFSLDSQKKVMWKVASDNYKQNTSRDLLIDLMSGNKDTISSTLVNNANIWQTLPGGKSASQTLPELVNTYTNTSNKMLDTIAASKLLQETYAPASAASKIPFAQKPSTGISAVDAYIATPSRTSSTSGSSYSSENALANYTKTTQAKPTASPTQTPAKSTSDGKTYDGATNYSPYPVSSSGSSSSSSTKTTSAPSKSSPASVPGTGSYTTATKSAAPSKSSAPSVPGGIGTYTSAVTKAATSSTPAKTSTSTSGSFASKPASMNASSYALDRYSKL